MRVSLIPVLLFLFFVSHAYTGEGQNVKNTKVSVNFNKTPLSTVLKNLKKQSRFNFAYKYSDVLSQPEVTYSAANVSLSEVLDDILSPRHLKYVENEDNIIILTIPPSQNNSLNGLKAAPVDSSIRIVGIVLDENNQPLPGASVHVSYSPNAKNGNRFITSRKSQNTDANGRFRFNLSEGEFVFIVEYVGYQPQTVLKELVNNRDDYNLVISLKPNPVALEDVKITTGLVVRNKLTFTGATSTFTGEQLKQVGNQNILQSLKSLDPSFIVLDNNTQGSNPNSLPQIELRGKTSITSVSDAFSSDPNLPLFVLDGFETTLQTISDLDINRVASITILKDAASTAMYGAKAANGVVVIETIRPKAGEIRVSYTNDSRLEIPDLNSYNMMNASEKLEFERLSGRYITKDPLSQLTLDELYNQRLKAVQEGVNTYWLKVPVRNGFTNGHSLSVNGGSQSLAFDAGLTYRNVAGAMKGSSRTTWSGNTNITYRKGKLNITNQMYISGYKSDESPYGDFSDFVNANPYYKMYDDNGNVQPNLDNTIGISLVSSSIIVPNPLYNALLYSINNNKNSTIRDNLRFIYTASRVFRFDGGIQVNKSTTEATVFQNPQNTAFADAVSTRKGSYSHTQTDNSSYSANLMVTYANAWGKHQLTTNMRGDIEQSANSSLGFTAEGFPYGSNGNPTFAYSYTQNSSPSAANSKTRRVNSLVSANYNYDMRYLMDLNYRLDGSTAFGSAKKYSPFWSVGVGWNVNREKFLENAKWLVLLKLRGNIGVTGNQNIGSTNSVSIYNYASGSNIFGQYLNLSSLGNPNLEWQSTRQISTGIDLVMFDNRFTTTFNYYNKYTDPLIVSVTTPSSVGVTSRPSNVGSLNVNGWEADLRYFPVRNLAKRIIWNIGVFGSIVRGKYGNFGNALSNLNDEQLNSNSLVRYHDGYSPDDIWAVRSKGIDPATGQEIFLKKNGDETFSYSSDDIVKVGNSRPTVEGVISSGLTFRGFSANVYIRYRFGGDLFNSALYSKVENISLLGLANNQDRRALYDRWKEVGDVSEFKSISLTGSTPMSSRFVQRDNQLVGESFSLGWQSSTEPWLKALKLRQVRFSAYLNNIFRMATTLSERGTSYPFTNVVSCSLNLSF